MIYFIRVCGTSYVKVGRARNVKSRLGMIATDNYQPVELCLTVDHHMGWYMDGLVEQELHQQLAEYRIRGEWFNLTPAIIETVLQRYKPDVFKDWNNQERTRIAYAVQNHIPDEIAFPPQSVTRF